MTDPIARAFPVRPLTITARFPAWKNWLIGLVGFVLIGGGAVVIATETVPALVSDREVAGRAVPLAKVQVREGRCRVRLGFLHTCDLTLAGPNGLRREVSYLFVDLHSASREVVPMGDPTRPELLTTDLGLERWLNRLLTFLGLGGAMLALAIACAALPFLAGRQRRLLAGLSGRVLQPVPAGLSVVEGQWIVAPRDGGPKQGWALGNKARPFVVDPASGTVLAVTAPGAPLFPLDEDLTWLDLSDEERTRLRLARDAVARGAAAAA